MSTVFAAASTVVRSGLLIGPYDNTARLSWWLDRVARGGEVVAPAGPERPLQLIDTRDLAAWMLHCGRTRLAGAYAATSPPASATFGELLAVPRPTAAHSQPPTLTPAKEAAILARIG